MNGKAKNSKDWAPRLSIRVTREHRKTLDLLPHGMIAKLFHAFLDELGPILLAEGSRNSLNRVLKNKEFKINIVIGSSDSTLDTRMIDAAVANDLCQKAASEGIDL